MLDNEVNFGQYIEFKVKNRIGIITLNKTERSNAFDVEQLKNYKKALLYCQNNKRIRAIILTANGKNFSTGIDVASASGKDISVAKNLERLLAEVVRILLNGKPVIAAINGRALGGGLEIPLFCDYRVALNEGYYQMPEILINVFPGTGCITQMVRTIGPLLTKKILMWGEKITPEQALNIGLIDKLVETKEKLMEVAMEKAKFLASRNQAVINGIRLCANHIWEKSYDEAYKMENYCSNWFEIGKEDFISKFKEKFNLLEK